MTHRHTGISRPQNQQTHRHQHHSPPPPSDNMAGHVTPQPEHHIAPSSPWITTSPSSLRPPPHPPSASHPLHSLLSPLLLPSSFPNSRSPYLSLCPLLIPFPFSLFSPSPTLPLAMRPSTFPSFTPFHPPPPFLFLPYFLSFSIFLVFSPLFIPSLSHDLML